MEVQPRQGMCFSHSLNRIGDDQAGDGGEENAYSCCEPMRGVSSTRLVVHEHTLQSY